MLGLYIWPAPQPTLLQAVVIWQQNSILNKFVLVLLVTDGNLNAAEHNITCDVEVIDVDYVNTAMERLKKNDVHYRFSIDVQGTLFD